MMAGIFLQKLLRWSLLLLLAGAALWVVLFSVFYLTHTYESSASLYLRLNGYCFYRSAFWQRDFFTAATKAAGNRHCMVAILLATCVGAYAIRQLWKDKSPIKSPAFLRVRANVFMLIPLLAAALLLWLRGHQLISPAYDEVFSAMNCAGMHPLGTLTYYMLPNNHVLFNVLNRLLFFWADNKLLTGRIVAGIAYAATVPVMYWLMLQLTRHKWLAGAITLLLILHFPVWGFGFQGRGYALYTLFGWLAAAAYYRHHSSASRWPLRIMSVSIVAGYATVPTFLYFHLGLLCFEGLRQLGNRKFVGRFWLHAFFAFAAAYLFYVPAIAFSGAGHLLDTATPSTASFPYVSGIIIEFVRAGFQHCFGFEVEDHNLIVYLLTLLPLTLLAFRGKEHRIKRATGLFYVLLWASFLAYAMYNRRWPFLRSMALHHSFTLAAVLLTFWWLAEALANRLKLRQARLLIVPVLLAFGIHFYRWDGDNASRCLYFYDVNPLYKTLLAGLQSLPKGSTIGLSDEGFYWEHLAFLNHYKAVKCPSGSEGFYIMQQDEPKPAWLDAAYTPGDTVWQYRIYRRKN